MNEPLRRNYTRIQTQLTQQAKLIAVTKTVSSDVMRALYAVGATRFGENRAESLLQKQADLQDLAIEWHFIGRLQTRQVKTILPYIDYLHSLDRMKLAHEIQKRATKPVNCFVQVNVSGEVSKAGFAPEEVMEVVEQLADYDAIRVVGLMTMAPENANEQQLRAYFSQLKALQTAVAKQQWSHAPCTELSMGMSGDYLIALEEGATYVRIGTALFEGV
ncbi:MAG: YggS family pyridoxal phosphate-dependent enzyme [Aerococcaceae bacterium]|nr:YggS family pyridoxal phosphate-dependent enzyme [Aerococcaceae bacterium]